MVLFVKCGSCVWPAGLTELLSELVLEGVPPVAACLDGTLVDADDEASRDHAVVGVEETDHVVVAATSRVEVVQVRSGRGEPDDQYDSRKGDAHHDRARGPSAVAELEAGLISERTKAAVAAAKQRGVRLGSYGADTLAPKYRAEAKVRAKQLAPLVRDFQKRGYSMRGIANELEKRKVQTPRGGSWHPQLVKRTIMQRLDAGRPPDATWGIRVSTTPP
jgi:hypothetical protein